MGYIRGAALSQVSDSESASAEELAATSEQLVENSNTLSAKTDESMSNLGELREWENVVADNVQKVETTSRDLLDKSMENEKLLNDLHKINGEVSESMSLTTDVAQKLSDAVQEIGVFSITSDCLPNVSPIVPIALTDRLSSDVISCMLLNTFAKYSFCVPNLAEFSSTCAVISLTFCCTRSITDSTTLNDSCVLFARLPTSVATTANPLPASPARAASIDAFSANKEHSQ